MLSVVSELFCGEVVGIFVVLLVTLLSIKSTVTSVVFWTTFFEVVLSVSVADFLAWSLSFWVYLPL